MSRFVLCVTLLAATGAAAAGQAVDLTVNLAIGGNGLAEHPFGIAVDPDGVHAYVAIAGELDQNFPSTPATAPLFNNSLIMKVDYRTGSVVATGPTGLFPEDVALTFDASGGTRHVFVTNSTSGTVTILDAALNPLVTVPLTPCFGNNFAAVFPFGIVASPDSTRVYVGTTGGCGTVDVIDADPLSPTFTQIVQSFAVPNIAGRMTWAPWPQLVLAATEFSTLTAGISVVNVTSPGTPAYHPGLFDPGAFGFGPGTTDVAALPGGTVLLPVSFADVPRLLEMDPATGAVLQNLDLSAATSELSLHGLAVSDDGQRGVLTVIGGPGEVVFLDLAAGTVQASLPLGPAGKPNSAAFSPDQGRVLVTAQGLEQVVTFRALPGFELLAQAAPLSLLGQAVTVSLDNLEFQQPGALYASLTGPGPQQVGGITIQLSSPFAPVAVFQGGVLGDALFSTPLPQDPGLAGLTAWFQAMTLDADGGLRLSAGTATTLQ